jgi:hypothetical protein
MEMQSKASELPGRFWKVYESKVIVYTAGGTELGFTCALSERVSLMLHISTAAINLSTMAAPG